MMKFNEYSSYEPNLDNVLDFDKMCIIDDHEDIGNQSIGDSDEGEVHTYTPFKSDSNTELHQKQQQQQQQQQVSKRRQGSGSGQGSTTPSSKSNSNSNSRHNNKKTKAKAGWLGRQIAAAYDEHALIIKKLRKELEESKIREQALVQEFAEKFREMQAQRGPDSINTHLNANTNTTESSSSRGRTSSFVPFEDEDMPMDEMADTARMERSAREKDRRALEEFKKHSDEQIHTLRKNSENQIESIEKALKEKVAEIDLLKRQISAEREYYKTQGGASGESTTSSPMTSSSLAGGAGGDMSEDDSIPIHSFLMQEHVTPSPTLSSKSGSKKKKYIISPDQLLLCQPVPLTPMSKSNVTPIDRIRRAVSTGTLPTRPMSESPQSMNEGFFDNSLVAIDGSAFEDTNSNNNDDNSPMFSPSPSQESKKVTLPTPRKLDPPQQIPSTHLMLKLAKAIEARVRQQNSKDKNLPKIGLNDEETLFVETIDKIFQSRNKMERKAISSLTTQLQESTREIQEGASKASQMTKQINEQVEQIQYLENQLYSAHASIRNTADLEGVLKMVANDRKATDLAETDFKVKLKNLEEERDELLKERNELIQEKNDSQEETENAVSAIQRVMADVTAAKDKTIEDLTIKLEDVQKENKLLRKKIDSDELLTDETSLVESPELEKLRRDARKKIEIEDEMKKINTELKNALFCNEELNGSLEELKRIHKGEIDKVEMKLQGDLDDLSKQNDEMQRLLNEKETSAQVHEEALAEVEELKRTITELLKKRGEMESVIENMTKKNETYKEEMVSVQDVLNAAKGAHGREQKLEDELSELRNLLDGSLKSKSLLKNDLQTKEEQLNTLQSKVISMKEEKLELRTNLRKAEEAFKRVERVLAVLQETGENEDSAPQIAKDMKQHLHDQHDVAKELRKMCDERSHHIVDKLSDGINTTLCLLEAVIHGDAILRHTSAADTLRLNHASALPRKDFEEEIKNECDQELIVLQTELARLKKKNEEYAGLLSKKDEEMNILRSSLKESSVGYISGDESDVDDEISPDGIPVHVDNNQSSLQSGKMQEILKAKEKAELEAKDNAERLANAKMIISSLEQSNKSMTEDLKSRLHDSNSAIVSLLDQSGKQEKESAELKSKLDKLTTEKAAVESELKLMKKQLFLEGGSGQKSLSNVTQVNAEKELNISRKSTEGNSPVTKEAEDSVSKTETISIENTNGVNEVLCDDKMEI